MHKLLKINKLVGTWTYINVDIIYDRLTLFGQTCYRTVQTELPFRFKAFKLF